MSRDEDRMKNFFSHTYGPHAKYDCDFMVVQKILDE